MEQLFHLVKHLVNRLQLFVVSVQNFQELLVFVWLTVEPILDLLDVLPCLVDFSGLCLRGCIRLNRDCHSLALRLRQNRELLRNLNHNWMKTNHATIHTKHLHGPTLNHDNSTFFRNGFRMHQKLLLKQKLLLLLLSKLLLLLWSQLRLLLQQLNLLLRLRLLRLLGLLQLWLLLDLHLLLLLLLLLLSHSTGITRSILTIVGWKERLEAFNKFRRISKESLDLFSERPCINSVTTTT